MAVGDCGSKFGSPRRTQIRNVEWRIPESGFLQGVNHEGNFGFASCQTLAERAERLRPPLGLDDSSRLLDFLIPLNERHLRMIVKAFAVPYNRGRPHSRWSQESGATLGRGYGQPASTSTPVWVPRRIDSRPRGLHHEYWLEREAA